MDINHSKTLQQQRIERLENKTHKVKRKDIESLLTEHLKHDKGEEGTGKNKVYVIRALNFFGNEVEIRCATKKECYENLAVLHGYTIED